MKRILLKWDKIAIVAAVAVVVALMYAFDIPCIFLSIFDVPCFTCGMTRACLSLFRLDFATAWNYHPLFWTLPIILVWFWMDGKVFGRKWLDALVMGFVAALFLIRWIFIII